MAVFRPILGELSGSVGNDVFSHNKGGAYVRRRAIPTNPNSLRQQAVRSFLQQLTSAWGSLSEAEKDTWRQYALNNPIQGPLGDSIFLTGHQWFVGLNSRLLDNGLSVVNTAPVTPRPNPLATMSASASAASGTITITFTPTPLASDQRLVVWSTAPQGAGNDPNRRQSRLQGYSSAGATSPASINSRWALTQGLVMNVYVGVMDSDNGLVSGEIKATVTIGA